MTKEEFDTFLASQDLVWEFSGGKVESSAGFDIGPGWYEITSKLIADLIALGWDKTIAQVKEKFGGGRFYIGGATNEIFERIRQWEGQTFQTCETCGTTEDVKLRGSRWLVTHCDKCDAAKTDAIK